MSKHLNRKFNEFISIHSPGKVRRHLQYILFDYIVHMAKIGFPLDFGNYMWELYDLFELLDCAEDEMKNI